MSAINIGSEPVVVKCIVNLSTKALENNLESLQKEHKRHINKIKPLILARVEIKMHKIESSIANTQLCDVGVMTLGNDSVNN